MAEDKGRGGGRRDNRRGLGRWRGLVYPGAALLWLLPLVAMGLDVGVDWSVGDFAVFGAMLVVACTGFELVFGLARSRRMRLAASVAIVLGFLWLWAELAVGVFTDWGS